MSQLRARVILGLSSREEDRGAKVVKYIEIHYEESLHGLQKYGKNHHGKYFHGT